MGRAVSRRDVEQTVRKNEKLIESADQEVTKLREERKRSEKVIANVKKNGKQSDRIVGT